MTTGKLRRVFVWDSFVTEKPAPRDLETYQIFWKSKNANRRSSST
jgi:hypothetical protein